jgi:hypothetical protein
MPVSQIQNASLASGVPGSTNLPAGTVIQVVAANNTLSSSTITSTSPVATGMEATITPKSATSKIYIMATFSMTQDGQDNAQSYATVIRNSSNLKTSNPLAMYDNPGGNVGFSIGVSYIDTPATTSATTYKIYGSVSSSSSQFRPVAGTDTIVLMEIAV